jgi:transcriptional regulator GlxA family with amidase domain
MTAAPAISPPIRRVMRHMEEHFAEPLSLAELARMCDRSLHRFATVFRQEVGIPPHQYLCRLRIQHAQSLLRQGTSPTIAAVETGFFDQSHLSRHFKRLCGVTPGRFIASGGRSVRDTVPLAADELM